MICGGEISRKIFIRRFLRKPGGVLGVKPLSQNDVKVDGATAGAGNCWRPLAATFSGLGTNEIIPKISSSSKSNYVAEAWWLRNEKTFQPSGQPHVEWLLQIFLLRGW